MSQRTGPWEINSVASINSNLFLQSKIMPSLERIFLLGAVFLVCGSLKNNFKTHTSQNVGRQPWNHKEVFWKREENRLINASASPNQTSKYPLHAHYAWSMIFTFIKHRSRRQRLKWRWRRERRPPPPKTKILTDWSLTEEIGLPLHCAVYSNQENSLENCIVP